MSDPMPWPGRAACRTADPELFFAGEPEDWRDQARCAETDPELWFPERGSNSLRAKRICAQCEVRAECLDYAMEHDEIFGIWGGLGETERRALRRQAGSRERVLSPRCRNDHKRTNLNTRVMADGEIRCKDCEYELHHDLRKAS
jgi:WhiB family transcriptional regulator, redox-sensing transcriptional regulator